MRKEVAAVEAALGFVCHDEASLARVLPAVAVNGGRDHARSLRGGTS